ncbi:MAG: cupin domain-containing protein [Phycisphaeraceae bacterium]
MAELPRDPSSDSSPPILGGVGLTIVRVYADQKAPDGRFSGCPHIHGLTDEAYFVLSGTGGVELHSLDEGFRTLEMKKGDYVQFPPNVLHRMLSDGDLEVLALMGNGGLAERGDARIYFGPDIDADPEKYRELQTLPQREGLGGAIRRRDIAVEKYLDFIKLWDTDRDAWRAELSRFIHVHLDALEQSRDHFQQAIVQRSTAAGSRGAHRLKLLPQTLAEEPRVGASLATDAGDQALGMCGHLRQIEHLGSLST